MNGLDCAGVVRSLLHQDDIGRIVAQAHGMTGEVTCRLWTIGDNDNYMLWHNGVPLFVRVYLAGKHWGTGESDCRFELEFLQHMHTKGVSVAHPLPNLNDDLLTPLAAPEGTRYLALFSYANGVLDPFPEDDERCAAVGRELAHAHRAGIGFVSHHKRFAIDANFVLLRPLQRIAAALAHAPRSRLTALLKVAHVEVMDALATLPARGDGVIFGDFHGSNYHLTANNVTLFDFDLCGVGWHVHDIATWTWDARKRFGDEKAKTLLTALLQGYESVLPLPATSIAALPALMIAREIWLVGEHCADIESLGAERLDERYWMRFEERLTTWLTALPRQVWVERARVSDELVYGR
ncbi:MULTISPECIES: phosphotransferase enzyme family protein [Paraburkholderia]|uniref:phosphotransferase enzyme family protein n=1 Tax=Paraburkholderia TaxID=1822464 RepID=UPI00225A3D6F|nr:MULTISPECIES: phosphotransferase [Paraburkholderia]MCX4162784.1 phosphotransferase [Paraburkholderia megapolitana]MDN7158279.1 phosphotransferase [Paraburkholderia sp. CHISQ3]MDQ6495326.1 phosphotransferase [Paraburkholderia megapolitana]